MGERPGYREAAERMTKRLIDAGMPPEQAASKAKAAAIRADKGANKE